NLIKGKNWNLGLSPMAINQLYNSDLPIGYNLGSAIAAKGYQIQFVGGIEASFGKHLHVKLNPEFVSAQNEDFEQISQTLGDRVWANYYQFLNTIDLPAKMGEGTYNKLFPGQSHITYRFNKFEAGISTENLWWGPGWKNALIMSYNAPGFLHASFKTIKPIQTKIGQFSGQWVGGSLAESGVLPPRIYSTFNGTFLYQPKPTDNRFMTGMHLSWQPKWMPYLTIGYSAASYFYGKDFKSPLDLIPIFSSGNKAGLGAFFASYKLPKEKAEIYLEYGAKNPNFRRAYVAGFRKLFPTKLDDAYIQFAVELTQMQAQNAELIRNPDSWYTNQYVQQGYTHMGKTIGAGIGPGSNSQNIEIAWVKGKNKIGLQFERLRHNSDFYYLAFEPIGDYRRHWIDLSSSANATIDFKHFLIAARVQLTRTYNYQWLVIQTDPNNYFQPSNEYLNLGGGLSVMFRL
ncbi:MAG TPA: capsule assembly Wzi family protein, partial [Sediminibacterium sp.]|nr:capsule assembly Wzi family protein [Sediminibacterium sp.]